MIKFNPADLTTQTSSAFNLCKRISCFLGITLIFCSSCSSLNRKQSKPAAILALFEFANSDLAETRLIRNILTESGETLQVRRVPILSSREIVAAKPVQTDEKSDVRGIELSLSRRGQIHWTRTCAEFAGDLVAVTLDGIYRFSVRVPRSCPDPRSIVLRGPWREDEVSKIVEKAEQNFRYFN